MLAAADKTTGLNDYRKIRRADAGRLQPKHTVLVHADSRLALAQFLAKGDRSRSAVITHHAPSLRSVPTDRCTDLVTAAYASNLDELILTQGPGPWIHGHIHAASDYRVGATRVIANPLGYQTAHNPEHTGFKADLVVDL